MVVAFINWELFELPGINLEDIVIPVKEYDCLPNEKDITEIKQEVILSLDTLYKNDVITKNDCVRIKNSIESFNVNPQKLNTRLVGRFDLSTEKGGTF